MRHRIVTVVVTLALFVPPAITYTYASSVKSRRAEATAKTVAACAATEANALAIDAILDYFQAAVLHGDEGNPRQLADDTAFFNGIPRPKGCH